MRGGSSVRRAVAASVGVHVLLAAGLLVLMRGQSDRPPAGPGQVAIDTRADVQFGAAPEEPERPVEVAQPPEPVTAPAPTPSPQPSPSPPAEQAAESTIPLGSTIPIPATLPPELLALMRKTPAAPAAAVVDAPGAVQPVGGVSTPPAGVAPVHGALAPGTAIVYVLDASGSMGEWGKFDAARRAVIATLRAQPDSVRVQVVVYAGTAAVPLSGPGGCLPATAETVARLTGALAALGPPAGRSDHAKGLQAALALRPDFVLIFTDAAELPVGVLRNVTRQSAKPPVVCVARVGEAGVARPVELK